MEQLHPFQGGEVQGVLTPHEESHDERVIRQGIEAAQKEEREIDDRTARYIASQLHGGQDSALYALASSGAVIEDDVYHELYEDLESHTLQVQQWVEALRTYCLNRERKEPIAGWARRAAELDKRDEQRWRLVGGMALANEASAREEREQEQDQFDDLFGEVPDEEIGTVDELGWFGLVRHEDKPGGLLLCQDEQGFRYIWEANSDEALAERWSAVTAEYGRFHEQQRAYGHE